MAFPLGHPAVVNVTVGMRTAEQVARNVTLHDTHVPAALWAHLRAEGLLRPDAPTPDAAPASA
jgi:D-threo-aldose 1-dehydrogenase